MFWSAVTLNQLHCLWGVQNLRESFWVTRNVKPLWREHLHFCSFVFLFHGLVYKMFGWTHRFSSDTLCMVGNRAVFSELRTCTWGYFSSDVKVSFSQSLVPHRVGQYSCFIFRGARFRFSAQKLPIWAWFYPDLVCMEENCRFLLQ